VNPLTTLARSNAILGLIILTIIIAPLIWLLSITLLVFALLLIYVRWLRRDVKILGIRGLILERLVWYLFRESIGRIFFDIGFILSAFKRDIEIGR
jgi:hypothetical protein